MVNQRYCSVNGCGNRSDETNSGVRFFKYPKRKFPRERWILFANNGDECLPKKSSTICSNHFSAVFFYPSGRKLTQNAIPSKEPSIYPKRKVSTPLTESSILQLPNRVIINQEVDIHVRKSIESNFATHPENQSNNVGSEFNCNLSEHSYSSSRYEEPEVPMSTEHPENRRNNVCSEFNCNISEHSYSSSRHEEPEVPMSTNHPKNQRNDVGSEFNCNLSEHFYSSSKYEAPEIPMSTNHPENQRSDVGSKINRNLNEHSYSSSRYEEPEVPMFTSHPENRGNDVGSEFNCNLSEHSYSSSRYEEQEVPMTTNQLENRGNDVIGYELSCSHSEHSYSSSRHEEPVVPISSSIPYVNEPMECATVIDNLELKVKTLTEENNLLKKKLEYFNISEEMAKEQSSHEFQCAMEIIRSFNRRTSKQSNFRNEPYSLEIRKFSITMFSYSAKSYSYLREVFNNSLPSRNTILSWLNKVDSSPGYNTGSLLMIREKVKDFQEKQSSLYLSLSVDDVSIRQHMELSGQNIAGYVDLGIDTGGGENSTPATHAMVCMCTAINDSWKIPVAYFLISDYFSGKGKFK